MNNALGFLCAFLALTSTVAQAAPALEEIVRHDYPVTPRVALSMTLPDGTVHIYGSPKNEIQMTAIKKAYTQRRLDGMKINVNISGDNASIETQILPKPQGLSLADRSGTVDYTLIVPQTCTLAGLEVENGEVIVEGLRGDAVNIRLTSGRITAKNCFSPTQITLGNGAMDLLYYWWEERPFSLLAETKNGDIRFAVPKNSSLRLDASTASGWVRNQFTKDETKPDGDGRSLQWTMGDAPTGQARLRAGRGNIRIEYIY
ncbi:MAG: DUF4097 domain-containing protein [Verrucomicrobiota bacterium]|nr:DUF4097 domain-containing protein [Verrucomicrobiota bacterium]